MGFLVVTAVLVVGFGRLGDMYGRVRMYNLGFLIFTVASVLLAVDLDDRGRGGAVADRLADRAGRRRRVPDGQLQRDPHRRLPGASSAAWRSASTASRRSPARSSAWCIGGLLGAVNWHLVFLVSVPFGVFGTVWAYLKLRDTGERRAGPDGLVGQHHVRRRPDRGAGRHHLRHPALRRPRHGLDQPVGAGLPARRRRRARGCSCVDRARGSPNPLFDAVAVPDPRRSPCGNIANLLASLGRGGLQFMLIIWLQGIWLPQHGYSFAETPLWAGIYMLPMTVGFLVAGAAVRDAVRPVRRRAGSPPAACCITALSFVLLERAAGRLRLPGLRACCCCSTAIGMGLFTSPNRAEVMNSLPAGARGAGRRHERDVPERGDGAVDRLLLQPDDRRTGAAPCRRRCQQRPGGRTACRRPTPPGSPSCRRSAVLFAAFLGYNPIQQLLGAGARRRCPRRRPST